MSAPAQVTDLAATVDSGQTTLTYTMPDDGGSPISSKFIEVYRQQAAPWWMALADSEYSEYDSGDGFTTVAGLANGVIVDFRIAFGNAEGIAPMSDYVSVTPVLVLPGMLVDPIPLSGNGTYEVDLRVGYAPDLGTSPPEVHYASDLPCYWFRLPAGTVTLSMPLDSIDSWMEIWTGDNTDPAGLTYVVGADDAVGATAVITDLVLGTASLLRVSLYGSSSGPLTLTYSLVGGDVVIPPPPVGVAGGRWVLYDSLDGEAWTMPLNPNDMSGLELSQSPSVGIRSPIDNRVRALRTRRNAREWTFSGVIRTKEHHDDLLRWSRKPTSVLVIDHFGRTWKIRFIQFDVEERKPTPLVPWRMRYSMKCLIYGSYA